MPSLVGSEMCIRDSVCRCSNRYRSGCAAASGLRKLGNGKQKEAWHRIADWNPLHRVAGLSPFRHAVSQQRSQLSSCRTDFGCRLPGAGSHYRAVLRSAHREATKNDAARTDRRRVRWLAKDADDRTFNRRQSSSFDLAAAGVSFAATGDRHGNCRSNQLNG